MNLISLPYDVRARIYHFCFPPAHSHVQLIPYRASSTSCHLNLPLSLYLVCKFISSELPELSAKLRSLDFVFVIQGGAIGPALRPEYGSRQGDDPYLRHFQAVLTFAERLRLVGHVTPSKTGRRSVQCSARRLTAGGRCALRVLEVQPLSWNKRIVTQTILSGLRLIASYPDVAEQLEVRLIGDDEGELEGDMWDEIKDWLRIYQDANGQDALLRYLANRKSS